MSKQLTTILTVLLLCLGLSLAFGQGSGKGGPPVTPPVQGQGNPIVTPGGQGQGQPAGPGGTQPEVASNPKKVETLTGGEIVDVMGEYGSAYPAIVFAHPTLTDPITVRLAPLWYLEEALLLNRQILLTFVGKPADLVMYSNKEDVYHAITLTVEGEGTYDFRTLTGKPLWNPSGKIKDRKLTDAVLEAGSTRDLGGEVLSVSPSLLSGELILAMLGDDGLKYRIRLADPEDLLATDFALREHNRVQVRFALEAQTRQAVALQFSVEARWTVRLRDENGQSIGPNWE